MHFLRTFALKHKTKITRMKQKLKVTRGPCVSTHMVYMVSVGNGQAVISLLVKNSSIVSVGKPPTLAAHIAKLMLHARSIQPN